MNSHAASVAHIRHVNILRAWFIRKIFPNRYIHSLKSYIYMYVYEIYDYDIYIYDHGVYKYLYRFIRIGTSSAVCGSSCEFFFFSVTTIRYPRRFLSN